MVDVDRTEKRAAERKLKAEVEKLTRVADETAARFLVSTDFAADCSGDYVTEKLVSWCSKGYGGELGTEEELTAEVEAFARRYVYRRRRRRRNEQLNCETPGIELLASREPGPDEIVQCADLLVRLLKPLPHLLAVQQTLFVRRILEEARFVDIERETGRSADASCKAIRRILDRLRKYLEGDTFDEGEIEDCLSMLDGFRNGA